MNNTKTLADAILRTFISPNEMDDNWEAANIVDAVAASSRRISKALEDATEALYNLGNNHASTGMGAIEAHGKAVLDASERIALALDNIAEAIREHSQV